MWGYCIIIFYKSFLKISLFEFLKKGNGGGVVDNLMIVRLLTI